MLKGELPWQGLKARNKDDKYRKIKDCKVNTPIEQLCHGYPGIILIINEFRGTDLVYELL